MTFQFNLGILHKNILSYLETALARCAHGPPGTHSALLFQRTASVITPADETKNKRMTCSLGKTLNRAWKRKGGSGTVPSLLLFSQELAEGGPNLSEAGYNLPRWGARGDHGVLSPVVCVIDIDFSSSVGLSCGPPALCLLTCVISSTFTILIVS